MPKGNKPKGNEIFKNRKGNIMESVGMSIAIIFMVAILMLVVGMGVVIVDALTSETLEPVNVNCLVTDKYIGSEDSWDKYRLICIDDEGTAINISVSLKQYTEININDTITVSKTTTESKLFGVTHDYRFAQ